MYTLYYAPGACSLSTHIVLEWVGAPYRALQVNPADPRYHEINPAGAVPALDIGTGAALTQCSAILKYLAREYPQAGLDLHGDHAREADLDRWAAFLTGDLHPAFFPVFKPERYTTDVSDSALASVKAAGVLLVEKKLAILEQHLEGRDHLAGGKRTYVDAYSIPMVRWATKVLPSGLNNFRNLARHHKRLLEDPAVIRVMTEEGLLNR